MRTRLVATALLSLFAFLHSVLPFAQSRGMRPELVPQYGHDFTTASIAANGRLAVTESFGTENRVRLWDFETGSLIRLFEGNKAALSPDGTLVAASSLDGPTHILETRTGESLAVLPTTNVVGIAAASDNSSFAIADHRESPTSRLLRIYVWNIRLGKQSATFDLDLGLPVENVALENMFLQLAFGPKAKSLVVGTSNWIETWSLAGSKRMSHVDNHGRVDHICFSTDGSMFAAASGNHIRIGMVESGLQVSMFEQSPRPGCIARGSSLTFSPNEKQLVTRDMCVRMWDYETGKELWSARRSPSVAEMMGAPVFWKDGKYVLAGNTFYDSQTGELFKSIGEVPRASGFSVSAGKSDLAMFAKYPDTQITTWLWDMNSGRNERVSVLRSPGNEWPWAVSENLETLVTSTGGRQISVRQFPFDKSTNSIEWMPNARPKDAPTTGAFDPQILMRGLLISGVFAPVATSPPINSASVCANKKLAAIGGNDYSGRLFNLETYHEVARVSVSYPWAKVALSYDCKLFAVGGADTVRVLDIARNETRDFKFEAAEHETVSDVSFSADNRFLMAGSSRGGANGSTYIWNIATTRLMTRLTATGPVTAVAFSSDGRYALAGYESGEIVIWDSQEQKQLSPKRYHGAIASAGFLPDNRHLFVSGQEGALEIWDTDGETALATLEFSPDGTWTVVAPDGRFDTNNLLANRDLQWVIPSREFEPLPIELFMRQYFEPRLLSKLLRGAQLPELPPISSLNLAQPKVEIMSIDANADAANSVNVRVLVKSQPMEAGKPSSSRVFSGVYDLRLFRDGQLVGQSPQFDVKAGSGPDSHSEEQQLWRKSHQVKLDTKGQAIITFHNIQLPSRRDRASVTFTAYAFNSDRVKSPTSSAYQFRIAHGSSPSFDRRAYLITMAVNANQSPHLDLEFAVPSAERIRQLMRQKLLSDHDQILEVSLYSDLEKESPQTQLKTAKKADLKAVFDLLSGRPVESQLWDEVDPHHKLQVAGPNDTVVLYIASHGYADPKGTFYLMPYDTGPNWGVTEQVLTGCLVRPDESASCKQATDLLAHSISSTELASWWSTIDAGTIVMILDSCHAGAAPGKEFRPGPLGDPGLGQLSFDKGMQILLSSQASQIAKGNYTSDGKGRTLLVEALELVAQTNIQDSLEQWLQTTETQLSPIARRLYPNVRDVQVPIFFDFHTSPSQ